MASKAQSGGEDHNSFSDIYVKLKSILGNDEFAFTGIIVALAVVLLSILLLIVINRRRNLRKTILIIGLCDSGKTLLFSQLIHKRHVDTHTSIKENSGTYQTKNGKKILRVVDLPGHERLRSRFVDYFRSSVRGIIFLVDSMTFQSQLKDVAGYLYSLLSEQIITHNCPALLVACNKQDNALAKSASLIKSQLEKEMNTLRVTRSAMLESTDSSSKSSAFIGKKGKDFEFQHLQPLSVDFAECTAVNKSEGPQLTSVEDWLTKIA